MKWYQRRLEEFNSIHSLHYNEPVSMRLHKKKYTCESCGELIPVDEVCSPSVDGDSFICDDCYDELYRFFCPLCGDLDENDDCYTGTIKICQTCQREILNKSLIKT